MVRALALLLLVVALVPGGAWAQTAPKPFNPTRSKAFHDFGSLQGLRFSTNEDARKVVDTLLAQFDLKSNYDVFVTDDSQSVPNAQAFYDPDTDRHQIIFNRKFMQQISDRSGGTPWALYGIAAHEIAHLMALHYERRLDYHTQELEADFFAGFALGKMGVPSYEDAVSFIRALPTPNGGVTHPPRARRLAAMGAGWAYAVGADVPEAPASAKAVDGPGVLNKFRTRPNRDIYGHDINSAGGKPGMPGLTLEACAKACSDTKECKAFSFNRWKGRCFLKDDVSGPSYMTPAAVSGVKPPLQVPAVSSTAPTIVEVQRNKVYLDEPFDTQIVATYDTCRLLCTTGPNKLKCIAFSYYKESRECRMFNGSEGYFYDQSVDSGYKRQAPDAWAPQ